MRILHLLLCAFAGVFLAFTAVTAHAETVGENSSVFTVSGVSVDVTADNAAAARNTALQRAQKEAFSLLAARLIPDTSRRTALLAAVEDNEISALIESFEINHEALSNVRYLATLTFYFKPREVENYFSARGQRNLVMQMPDTMLVLPVMRYSDLEIGSVIWEDNNLWLDAWRDRDLRHSFVPVKLPPGDETDRRLAAADSIVRHRRDAVDRLMQHHRATDAVIAIFEMEDALLQYALLHLYVPDSLNDTMRHVQTINLENVLGEDNGIFQDGIDKTLSYLEIRWQDRQRERTQPDVSGYPFSDNGYGYADDAEDMPLVADVAFANMREWLEIQKRLNDAPAVRNTEVVSLGRGSARVKIDYRGSPEQLRRTLSQAGLDMAVPVSGLYGRHRPQIYEIQLSQHVFEAVPPAAPENGALPHDGGTAPHIPQHMQYQ
ncbi:MAG: DUF2066 domain-containing protein [Micavibrio sp.]|nr:MAG: DUF2066 domain-containing protein [Micavibrio sp.]